jgi:uncharacterized protein (DUF2267 family)
VLSLTRTPSVEERGTTSREVIVSTTEATVIEESAQKTLRWLDELAEELGRPGDQKYALRVLRGFLHTLRDRLPVPETAHLGAQLPEFLRGIFYEGWRPTTQPSRYHDLETFLDRVAERGLLAGATEAAYGAEASARVLRAHVGVGELDKVRSVLPREIVALLSGETEGGRHADA